MAAGAARRFRATNPVPCRHQGPLPWSRPATKPPPSATKAPPLHARLHRHQASTHPSPPPRNRAKRAATAAVPPRALQGAGRPVRPTPAQPSKAARFATLGPRPPAGLSSAGGSRGPFFRGRMWVSVARLCVGAMLRGGLSCCSPVAALWPACLTVGGLSRRSGHRLSCAGRGYFTRQLSSSREYFTAHDRRCVFHGRRATA